MFITTSVTWDLDGSVIDRQGFDYHGPIALACGATSSQKNIATEQSDAYKTAIAQASSIFGSSSQVFNDLIATYEPIISAGPSQRGFSEGEKSNLDSSVITQVGNESRNLTAASRNAQAAIGGGNLTLSSGAAIGRDFAVQKAGADETSRELSANEKADYDQGHINYQNAVAGLTQAPGVFGTATQALGAATGAGQAASAGANSVANQPGKWSAGLGLISALSGNAQKAAAAGA